MFLAAIGDAKSRLGLRRFVSCQEKAFCLKDRQACLAVEWSVTQGGLDGVDLNTQVTRGLADMADLTPRPPVGHSWLAASNTSLTP